MEHFEFPKTIIKWIKNLYEKSILRINQNVNLSKKIKMERGLKQGCPLAANLYTTSVL